MKAAGLVPTHHEAIPRPETRIGQGPAGIYVDSSLNYFHILALDERVISKEFTKTNFT
jgi:hypothetical protein